MNAEERAIYITIKLFLLCSSECKNPAIKNDTEFLTDQIKQAEQEAYADGQREMREKIFRLPIVKAPDDMDITDPKQSWIDGYEEALMECRALPLTTRGGEDAK